MLKRGIFGSAKTFESINVQNVFIKITAIDHE